MLFMIYCVDKPDSADVRKANRENHLAYLRSYGEQILAAGPTTSETGEAMTGSLLLMDFPDRRAAEAFAENDPYARAGLFDRVEIKPWKRVLP